MAANYTIQGVKIVFPHKPYPSQFCMMERIIKGLERRQNCLLESPTGSGKSLALLCSSLAWLETEKGKAEIAAAEEAKKSGCCTCPGKETEGSSPYFPAANEMQGVPGTDQSNGVGVASANIPTGSSPYFPVANQMPAVPGIGQSNDGGVVNTPGKAANPIMIDDIEDFDMDDDFKCEKKKFRTPGQGSRPQFLQPGAAAADDEEVMRGMAELTGDMEQSPESKCCSCQCAEEEMKLKKIRLPKIYFGTRTHKQIAQIARELGKTEYKHSRMTILASRQHTCIDPEVSSMPNKNEECRNKLDGPGCRFKDRAQSVTHNRLQDFGLDTAWDLEEFVGFCKKTKACPYFGSRGLRDTADIVLCPYNYLIDPKIRNSMEINLKDQVVILDEGHNIEDSAREAASFKVTLNQINEAQDDLQNMIQRGMKPSEHAALKRLTEGLSDLIRNQSDSLESRDYDQASKFWAGMDMVAQLNHAGAGQDKFDFLKKCLGAISEDEEDAVSKWKKRNRPQKKQVEQKVSTATLSLLEGLFIILDYIYREKMKYMPDYRLALIRTTGFTYSNQTDGKWLNRRRRGQREPTFVFTLNFWCLNPAVAFSDMKDVRSVILTSGTLSPMTSFQSELDTPFPIQLEASHVIGRSQVWVGAVSRGPRGGTLLGSYQNAETFTYQDEVGDLLLQVCQTIPNGVLCFLSSYKAMEKLSSRWKTTGTWDQIQQQKVIMCEPRASENVDFDEMMKTFYRIIEKTNDQESLEADKWEGDVLLDGKTGALFLAVVRGKVSEGMDFADNNARAVMTVGIPYPNVRDTQVELKKQYNNEHSAKRGLLSGRDWYEIQAYRALNQALGRCIRHRHDWGALILVDERFAKNPQKYVKGLSKWLRNKVQFYQYFQQARTSLQQFTRERQQCAVTNDVSIMMSQSPNISSTQRVLGFTPATPTAASPVPPHSQFPTPRVSPQGHTAWTPAGDANDPRQYFKMEYGGQSVLVLAHTVEEALGCTQILEGKLYAGGVLAPPKKENQAPGAAPSPAPAPAPPQIPARYMNMSQAGGFLPTQDGSQQVGGSTQGVNATSTQVNPVVRGTQFDPPTQFNPGFTSTQNPSQFCSQFGAKVTSPPDHTAAESSEATVSTPRGKLTFDTPQNERNSKRKDHADSDTPTKPAGNSQGKSLFKFVDMSKNSAKETGSRSESPDLFDDEECFSSSPPKDLEPKKIDAILDALDAAKPGHCEKREVQSGAGDEMKPKTEISPSDVKTEPSPKFDRNRNKLKKRSLSCSKIETASEKTIASADENKQTVPEGDTVAVNDETIGATDGNEEEFESLNLRRSKRRRTLKTPTKTQQSTEAVPHSLKCINCGVTLANVKELKKSQDLPHFVTQLDATATEVYVCDLRDTDNLILLQQKQGPKGHAPPMNSYWSEADQCTVQWRHCPGVHPGVRTGVHRVLSSHTVCAHVVNVIGGNHQKLQAGQVWFVHSAVTCAD